MNKFLVVFLLFCNLLYSKTIIGKNERVTLSQFNIKDLRAKIDTGAKTSSLHCSYIKKISDDTVAFIILGEKHKKYKGITREAKISRISKVKSSNGKTQERFFIKTNIIILDKEFYTELSLSNRKNMHFPVLIGRNLLKKDFLVDVTKEYTSTSSLK